MSLNAGVRKICAFVLVFGVLAPRAFADFAVCQAGWEWATNSKQQNPCEIAGALEAACQGYSVYELGPLKQGTNYVAPQKNSSGEPCECNTVMYSLYMACTACQNVTTQPWEFWSLLCDQVYNAQYPEPIPLKTAVPHWAFLSYNANETFNPVTAKSAGSQPEVLAPVPSTVTLSTSSTGSGSPSTGSTNPTSTSSNQDNGDEPKASLGVGVIVGIAVGGLAVLAAIGVGAWIFLRRRAAVQVVEEHPDYPSYSAVASSSEHGMGPSQMRLYDPHDPSTYPTHDSYEPSAPYTTNRTTNGGRYTGVPEL